MSGTFPISLFPIVLGHEGAGIVESVGEGVTGFEPGDHAIPLFLSQCRECKGCKVKNSNSCKRTAGGTGLMADGTSRFSCRGQRLFSFICCSTFSEYTVVSAINLSKINDKAPLDKVCLLGCGVTTGYGAAVNAAKVEPGSTCAVWGLGALGLSAILGCKNSGASRIFAIDINPSKFKIAGEFGATDFINPNDLGDTPIQKHLHALTGGDGIDYTFEAVGSTPLLRDVFESSANGYGVCIMIGNPSAMELVLNPWDFLSGRTLRGTVFGSYKAIDGAQKLVKEYLSGKLNFDKMITHEMSLDQVNEAFDLLKEGKCIRTVITL